MKRTRERGMLLLPVALTLAVIGALAYTMTREGSMNASAVDAQYEIETARYLAASGAQVAKWRTAKDKCANKGARANFSSLTLPGGTVDAELTKWDKGVLTVSVTVKAAASAGRRGGAVHALTREMPVHNLADPKEKTFIGGEDTVIVKNDNSNRSGEDSLVATDDTSLPLVRFELPGEMDNALITQANMKLTRQGPNATPADRSLGVHRITRAWSSSSVTWTTPWAAPGGDYVEQAAASLQIDQNPPPPGGAYVFPIHSLVQGWVDDRLRNHGMLLKPTRLINARFTSFEGASKPELYVHYYLRCT